MIRAVLFDVGGPLDLEIEHERMIDDAIRAALAAAGRPVSDEEYRAAERAAVASFAPNAYRAMIWMLSGCNAELSHGIFRALVDGEGARSAARGGLEPRPGMDALLGRLRARGLLLGIVANQPRSTLAELERHGLARHFVYREVSGDHGYRKPDVRAFLHACEGLAVTPAETIMVGDRIDNDIAPARALGLRTVCFRTGRHIHQKPRAWDEVPDAEVRSVEELQIALGHLVASAGS